MFGKRADGRRVKNIDPLMHLIPFIMTKRSDSQIFLSADFDCDNLDGYIREQAERGVKLTYMDIALAAVVRTIAQRPSLNRFVMKGRIFARPKIWVSLSVHRSLRGDQAETTIKAEFTGHESIHDIAAEMNRLIEENTAAASNNDTDKLAKTIMSIPLPLIGFSVGFLKFLDRRGILPKSIIEASPFHTTLFFTNMKSIGVGGIYHHIYDFGTTGIFLSMGKEQNKVVPDRAGNAVVKKMLPFGLVADERFCDGLYYARSMRLFYKYMSDPSLLEQRLDKVEQDVR